MTWNVAYYWAWLEALRTGHKMYVYGVLLEPGRWIYGISPVKPESIR